MFKNFGFSTYPSIVGLEIDAKFIRMAQVRIKKGKIKVEIVRELPINESKKLLEGISKKLWVSALLPQRKVLVRNLPVKNAKLKDALKALEFELEPKLPFPLQNAIIQHKSEKVQKNEIDFTVYICEKESIKEFLTLLKSKSLFADRLTCISDSLAQICYIDNDQKEKIIIYIGEEESSVILAKKGRVLAQHSFRTEDNQLSFSIQRTVLNFANRFPNTNFSQIYLFGKNASYFSAMIYEATKKNIHTLTPLDSLSENEWRTFAPVIGAALQQKSLIDFRQKEFSKKFPFKQEIRPAIASLALSFLTATILFFSGTLLDKKEITLHQADLNSICNFINEKGANSAQTPIEFQQFSFHLAEKLSEKNLESKKIPHQISGIFYEISQRIEKIETLEGSKIIDFQWEIKKRANPSSPRIPYEIECKLIIETAQKNSEQAVQKILSDSSFIDQNQKIIINCEDKTVTALFMLATGGPHA